MTRSELKAQILSHLKIGSNWGDACNVIQDVADKHLSTKAWNAYIIQAAKDMAECEESDFLVMNGKYWDWKEFGPCATEIVNTFLDYFGDADLEIIAQHM